MDPLRAKLIRLAHANPDLRPHLLPLVTSKTESKTAGNAARECLSLAISLENIMTATDDDELESVPLELKNIQVAAGNISRAIGTDIDAARNLGMILAEALSRRVKVFL